MRNSASAGDAELCVDLRQTLSYDLTRGSLAREDTTAGFNVFDGRLGGGHAGAGNDGCHVALDACRRNR